MNENVRAEPGRAARTRSGEYPRVRRFAAIARPDRRTAPRAPLAQAETASMASDDFSDEEIEQILDELENPPDECWTA